MSAYQQIEWNVLEVGSNTDDRIGVLQINRPDQANAFSAVILREITEVLQVAKKDSRLRAIVIAGRGKHFSAGADLQWMQASRHLGLDENFEDAKILTGMFEQVSNMPVPTIAVVQGAAYGGAVGLAACCDVVIAAESAKFCLSEVRLGLLPAVISPYVARRIGLSQLSRFGLTAKVISAEEALRIGLADRVVQGPSEALEQAVREELNLILAAGPGAQIQLKKLVGELRERKLVQGDYTAEAIAAARRSEQGQQGLDAFFAKRKAPWYHELPLDWQYHRSAENKGN